MNVSDMLARLEPLQRNAVLAVYFQGRTPTEAARVLAVERAVLLAALAVAFRRIARWISDDQLDLPGGVFRSSELEPLAPPRRTHVHGIHR